MDGIPAYAKQQWPRQRQFDRHELQASLRLIAPGGAVYRGWCKDVCEGGIGATVAASLSVGDEVSLEFQLPVSSEPLRLKAVVRYTSNFYHGFEFTTLSPEQRKKVQLYLESKLQAERRTSSFLR